MMISALLKASLLLLILFQLNFQLLTAQHGEDSLSLKVNTILNSNRKALKDYIANNNINQVLTPDGKTLLVLSIENNKPQVVKYIIHNNVYLNKKYNGLTPLMLSCSLGKLRITKLLLKAGANVNEKDSAGNTVLIISSIAQSNRFAKALLKHGASFGVRNYAQYNAKNIAVLNNNQVMSHYLQSYFERHLPAYIDGPYINFPGRKRVSITYIRHDSLHQHTINYNAYHKLVKPNIKIKGFTWDTTTYYIQKQFYREPSTYKNVSKLFVVGDVHGQCDSLIKLLQANQIIDKNNSWNFGKGHLIFLGDILDRGEEVTQALWLIYKLEREAEQHGGKVHLILGNHELMEMSGDQRYLSEKYHYTFKNLNINYQRNFTPKTLFGSWLRSKNTMIKVNDILFVHGGINPGLLNFNQPIDSINQMVYKYLNAKHKKDIPTGSFVNYIFGNEGPFWYRGLVAKNDVNPDIEDIDKILAYYKINRIIVGHTYLPQVSKFYDGKVIGTDVPFYLIPGKPIQALYIENNTYYLVNTSGEKELF